MIAPIDAYYSTRVNDNLQLVGLNTNLYYKSNNQTIRMPDPANQFQWLDDTLTDASTNNRKVNFYLIFY